MSGVASTPAALGSDAAEKPAEIGGYRIEEIPRPGETYIARAPSGPRVVLKMLEADCLSGSQLHPNIHDRLARVREAATLSLANLLGVERDGQRVFMVWEYVEGESLRDAVGHAGDSRTLLLLARDILLAANSLHALGLVHGALHEHNIFNCRDNAGQRQIILTHVSPFLYNDPAADIDSIAEALRTIIDPQDEKHAALRGLLDHPAVGGRSVDFLVARLNEMIDAQHANVSSGAAAREERVEERSVNVERRHHVWSWLKLAMVIVAAIVVFFVLQRFLQQLNGGSVSS